LPRRDEMVQLQRGFLFPHEQDAEDEEDRTDKKGGHVEYERTE